MESREASAVFEIVPGVGVGPLRLGMTRDQIETVCRVHGIGHSGELGQDCLHIQFDGECATRISISARYPFARLSLAGELLTDVSFTTLRALLARIIPSAENPESSGLDFIPWELSDPFASTFLVFLPGYRTVNEDGTPFRPRPARPTRTVSATIRCAVCDRAAAVVTMTASTGVVEIGAFDETFQVALAVTQRQPVRQAVESANASQMHSVAARCAPFYCPTCGESYCRDHRQAHPHPEVKRAWSLGELVTLFPNHDPTPEGVVVSRPDAPVVGHHRYTDEEETTGHSSADVTLTVAPAREFAIRFDHAWPDAIHPDRREKLQRGLLLGILKAMDSLALPSALGSCDVVTSAVVCDGKTTERAMHVAALRAVRDALATCTWTTVSPPFPAVAIAPGEDLEAAGHRAIEAFRTAGYDPREGDASYGGDLSPGAREFARLFLVLLDPPGSRQAHFFFVCPLPWSAPWTSEIEKQMAKIDYLVGREGDYSTRFHFLSAGPVPGSIAQRSDVESAG